MEAGIRAAILLLTLAFASSMYVPAEEDGHAPVATFLPPTVVSTDPPDGSVDVPLNVRVIVIFSEFMDKPSVQSALTIVPSVSGTFYWPGSERMEFVPGAILPEYTNFTVRIAKSAKSLSGVPMDTDYVFGFRTRRNDPDPPSIVATRPSSGWTGVSLNQPIRVQFNEPVVRSTAEGAFSSSPSATGSFAWPKGDTLVFTATANFAPNTNYRVTVAAGVEDATGNQMASPYTFDFQTGTTADTTPPALRAVVPLDGSKVVSPFLEVVMRFTEPIDYTRFGIDPQAGKYVGWDLDPAPLQGKGQGEFTIWSGGSVVRYYPKMMGFGWPGFANNTTYTVRVFAGLEDMTGNQMPSDYIWSFTTGPGAPAPPKVTSYQPPDGTSGVPTNTPMSVAFDQAMVRSSVEAAFSTTPAIAGSFSWSAGDTRVEVAASGGLLKDTAYSASLNGSAKSVSGVALGATTSWTFRTGSFAAPQIVWVLPTPGAKDVALDAGIWMQFDQPMDRTSTERALAIAPPIDAIFYWSDGDKRVEAAASAALAPNTQYSVTLAANASSAAGVAVGTPISWDFRTVKSDDKIPPVVVSTRPSDKDWGVATDSTISVRFSEPLDPLTFAVDRASSEYVGFMIFPTPPAGLGSGTLTFVDGGSTAVFAARPPGPGGSGLAEGQAYLFTVLPTVKDLAGNKLDIVFQMRFATQSAEPLRIDSHFPGDSEFGVPTGRAISVKFSRSMVRTSAEASVAIDPATAAVFSWDAGDTLLVIRPEPGLEPSKFYRVTVRSGAESKVGLKLESDVSWSFTTSALPPGPGPQSGWLSDPWFLVAIGAAIAVVSGSSAAVLLRRARKRRRSEAESAAEPAMRGGG